MATFKTFIRKDRQRADKTWNVLIRFTHDRKTRYIPTTMYVSKKDLTASWRIKNSQILDKCNMLIAKYRNDIAALNLELNAMDIDSVIDYLNKIKDSGAAIDFTYYMDMWVETHKELKGLRNYKAAFNALQNFFGHKTIMSTDITSKSMKMFCESLSDHPRAQSLYASSIVRVFNDMKDYYNDEDNGIIRIHQSLSKFKAPRQNVAKKRALSVEDVVRILRHPYDNIKVKGQSSRHDLALDCFRLSFCLMGMNSADLYNAVEYDGEYIVYNRTKTKDRRSDHALMKVRVHPCIRELVEKYRDTKRVFNFYNRFSTMSDFNRAINLGLKEVGSELGIDNLQFYAARHSMASIAVNKVGISKYIVNDMLCHTDPSMRITDLYIEKDFTLINNDNFRLLDYMLNLK